MHPFLFVLSLTLALFTTRAEHLLAQQDAPPAEVIVLSTLHQLHERVPDYGFGDLASIIEALEPDVLAVELTAEDLVERGPERVKQEYPNSVYPLLDEHGYTVVPLEPSEPLQSRMLAPAKAAALAFAEESPQEAQAFGTYTNALMEHLFERWDSPAAVNSSETDALFAVKHRFQDALFPPAQAELWDAWNRHFLDRIVGAARVHPGQRILVLVGAEHGYWLRKRLAGQGGILLLDTAALLEAMSKGSVREASP